VAQHRAVGKDRDPWGTRLPSIATLGQTSDEVDDGIHAIVGKVEDVARVLVPFGEGICEEGVTGVMEARVESILPGGVEDVDRCSGTQMVSMPQHSRNAEELVGERDGKSGPYECNYENESGRCDQAHPALRLSGIPN
jgi:hypothetical protein